MSTIILLLIEYLKQTKDSEWCLNIVRSNTNQNCIFGHVFNFGKLIYPNLNEDMAGSRVWDWFEECIGTSFYVFDINDGKNKDYPQATPKERCINYLYNILLRFEKTTHESMSYEFLKYSLKAQN